MLNKNGERELCYLAAVTKIEPIEGYDRVELAYVNGWTNIVPKGAFKEGDYGVFFEVDSKVPEEEPFKFLEKRHYKIKVQKMCKRISTGLLMATKDFIGTRFESAVLGAALVPVEEGETIFLTRELEVKYAVAADNDRKGAGPNKYEKMKMRHSKLFKKFKILNWIYKYNIGKKILFLFLGKKKDSQSGWPVNRFPGVSKTDQERVENMTWILSDKTPFIVTEKCDGSSATYILERKPFGKFEFYVCSRNVRMFNENQECFYGERNYYWEAAEKYNIESKMRSYLLENPDISFVCWQGEICAPGIQKNPHALKDTHLYLFHMTDSKNGRYDIREAKKIWEHYLMEVVPIVNDNYILPDDFEELKAAADGMYSPEVCEKNINCEREGYVYYKTTDPTFSFKNVSRSYLLNRG